MSTSCWIHGRASSRVISPVTAEAKTIVSAPGFSLAIPIASRSVPVAPKSSLLEVTVNVSAWATPPIASVAPSAAPPMAMARGRAAVVGTWRRCFARALRWRWLMRAGPSFRGKMSRRGLSGDRGTGGTVCLQASARPSDIRPECPRSLTSGRRYGQPPAMPPVLEKPIVLVGPPGSGEGVLFRALARASGVWRPPGDGMPRLDDAVPSLAAGANGRPPSHRLTADDAAEADEAVRARLLEALVDREGRPAAGGEDEIRPLLFGWRLTLRVSFLEAIFPDARFVYLHRDPAESIQEMLAAWQSGQFVSAPTLEGWDGPPWSLPLIPRWRDLNGASLEEIVVEQWRAISETLLD